jgi:hypothetical protein
MQLFHFSENLDLPPGRHTNDLHTIIYGARFGVSSL